MSAAENKALARRWLEEFWSKGNLALADELFAAHYVRHDPATPLSGPEGIRQYIAGVRTAFPDMRFVAEDVIAEGQKVVVRWVAHGSDTGGVMGRQPTGKAFTLTGMDILRIVDGKIEES